MAAATTRTMILLALVALLAGCATSPDVPRNPRSGKPSPVRLVTLDPGHFHAALVQKTRPSGVSPVVHVFAPDGPDVSEHLARVDAFNSRPDDPTDWDERVVRGPDYLERMLRERPGNVVVLSGRNARKADYVRDCVDAGLDVFADKPMCIDSDGLDALRDAFDEAQERGVLVYDMMTERSEITTILQKELAGDPLVFGSLDPGSPEDPCVVMESVHHFSKLVAGRPNRRPPWYFDTDVQGEGIVDVTTHLVDLLFWECFPGEALDFDGDIRIVAARRWPTVLRPDELRQVTGLDGLPEGLEERQDAAGGLPCFANGEISLVVRGVHARITVRWDFVAPPGGGDTHLSRLRGTRSSLVIRQGPDEGYRRELTVEPHPGMDEARFESDLRASLARLGRRFPGLRLERVESGLRVRVPAPLRTGHEEHFGDVTDRFLRYRREGSLPAWEVPNMLAKYRVTTEALEAARPPEGAIPLFDGSGIDAWRGVDGGTPAWTVEDGTLRVAPGSGSLVTRETFQDFRLHVEFKVPPSPPEARGQGRGNSGVYLQRRYEVQILDSFGLEAGPRDCGALYAARAPDRNACRPAGEWQSYDITFRAPRWIEGDSGRRKESDARITVVHNGVEIHVDVDLDNKTGAGLPEGPEPGPILLQDHGHPVEFRNIWIIPLTEDDMTSESEASPDTDTTRREFLVQGARAAAGIAATGGLAACASPGAGTAPVVAPPQAFGANERIHVAVIGIRSRGRQLAQGFAKIPGVRIKTLCDVDTNLFAERLKDLETQEGGPPGVEQDLRRVFDDRDIDAVVVATADHWHALATIWGCQSGKHVYVEKPCSHNVWEGRKMVDAARRYNRIVSVGFQNRSIGNVRRAMRFLHEGGIGEVFQARGLCFKPRDSIGRFPDGTPPAGVDYDLWLGAAPKRPFNKNRFHYNWHWIWDYGSGDIGNQGPHQFDIARWGLNERGHPVSIQSEGGYYAWDSDQETPNTQTASFRYADGKLLTFEVRGLYTNDENGIRIGNLFYGTQGWMHLNGSTWKTYFGRKNEPGPSSETVDDEADPMNLAGAGGGGHFGNFLHAVRTGDRGFLTCGIEEGFVSTALPHLANIAYRVGETLEFDGDRERFVGSRKANALLTRKYREPFVIPREV